tara:strand:+ start:55197 stop:55586 length:390 start_codon:yes stop_codon:yes gene_type:complete
MPDAPTIVLYDGICPSCNHVADRLRRIDDGRGKLKLVDLRQDQTYSEAHDLHPAEIRRVMHAITPDGRVHKAMDAVRVTMQAVDRGWMLAWTKLPLISWVCDRLYLWFAKNRLRFFKGKRSCDDACSIE